MLPTAAGARYGGPGWDGWEDGEGWSIGVGWGWMVGKMVRVEDGWLKLVGAGW